jgi:hypothetical protein
MSESVAGWEAVDVMRKDPEAVFECNGAIYRFREGNLEVESVDAFASQVDARRQAADR